MKIKIGDKFGRLTVINKAEPRRSKSGRSIAMWECRCECGKVVIIRAANLLNGHSKSCGCIRIETATQQLINSKHLCPYNPFSDSNTKLYQCWISMKARCYGKTSKSNFYYKKNHITICEEWLTDFQNFKIWALENNYNDKLSLDRIDGNKGYYPQNCRWVTMDIQHHNQKNAILVEWNGETKSLSSWALALGITDAAMIARYRKGDRGATLFRPKSQRK